MGITIVSYKVDDAFEDARDLIERIEEKLAPRTFGGKLKTARQLLDEVKNELDDGEAGERGR